MKGGLAQVCWGLAELCCSESTTHAAAPAFVGFESWAPRTPIPWSFVTATTWASMLHPRHAQPVAPLLRRGILPFHHHQLLSAAAFVGQCAKPRAVGARSRTSPTTLPFRAAGLCGNAGICAPARPGAGTGRRREGVTVFLSAHPAASPCPASAPPPAASVARSLPEAV